MDDAALEAVGWTQIPAHGFTHNVGPFWSRRVEGALEVGFVGQEQHANHINTINGGMLCTFADVAFGFATVLELGAPTCATAHLALQFISTAQMGELVTCKPEVIRRTSQLVFLRGLLRVEEKIVAAADGIWKVLTPRG